MKTVAFFNNKGGVGKTTLVYHLSWMFTELGLRVVAADLDPQANLTSMFLDDERLEELWPDEPDQPHSLSVMGSLRLLIEGVGDVAKPHVETISQGLGLIVGDLELARIEDELSEQWPKCLDRQARAFRVISAFYRILVRAAEIMTADIILVDVGPNLGAINRTALTACDYVCVPLAPDLYSVQALRNLGPSLRRWREEWEERIPKNPTANLLLPSGNMKPIGYVMMQHAVRNDRPVKAYNRWAARIPHEYRTAVLDSPGPGDDCLAQLKHYRSLMPMSMEAHKPMFSLRPADGAIGAHSQAVTNCYHDFENLAYRIAAACDMQVGGS
jgi:chromosome partitioning protein